MQETKDIQNLPEAMLQVIKGFSSEVDLKELESVSKTMYALFQPKTPLFDKFLHCVAFGMQDKVEDLLRDVYSGNVAKIQETLKYQGLFTDYSGRTFHCSAYEYAYWAKDSHMCRMLEHYMNEETKTLTLERILRNDAMGLTYLQNGIEHLSAHFDLSRLIIALETFHHGYRTWWAARDTETIKSAWMNIGLAQRDVPAHVAQEYCRRDRAFPPCPKFNEPNLPRILTFHNHITGAYESWFPLSEPESGLGFDFSLILLRDKPEDGPQMIRGGCGIVRNDLEAMIRLDEVRTADLAISRDNLSAVGLFHTLGA